MKSLGELEDNVLNVAGGVIVDELGASQDGGLDGLFGGAKCRRDAVGIVVDVFEPALGGVEELRDGVVGIGEIGRLCRDWGGGLRRFR